MVWTNVLAALLAAHGRFLRAASSVAALALWIIGRHYYPFEANIALSDLLRRTSSLMSLTVRRLAYWKCQAS